MCRPRRGRIEEGSAAWQALSAGDQAKRRRAAEEVRLKLRSPNFLVSRTRLSLRNLPPSLDEKALRTLAMQAVKQRATAAHPHIKQVRRVGNAIYMHGVCRSCTC